MIKLLTYGMSAMLALTWIACSGSGSLSDKSPTPGPTPTPRLVHFDVLLPDGAPHMTANIREADLIGDGSPQILVSEPLAGRVVWLHGREVRQVITEGLTQPVRTHVIDIDGDGDIIVADIGILNPSDKDVGRVVVLLNNGSFEFESHVVLEGEGVGRTVCAEGGDFDMDGDIDIAVCVFGHTAGRLSPNPPKDVLGDSP